MQYFGVGVSFFSRNDTPQLGRGDATGWGRPGGRAVCATKRMTRLVKRRSLSDGYK